MLLFIFWYNGYSQEVKYEIAHKNHKLGDLIVSRIQDNNETVIKATSSVRVKLIVHINLKYELISSYNLDGKLTSSSVKTYVNEKLHSSMVIEKESDIYQITNDKKHSIFKKPISYSGAMLYLYEPANVTKMFSEIDGYEINVKDLGNHTYQLIHPGNTTGNSYVYKDGILQHTTIHHTLLSFTITKV